MSRHEGVSCDACMKANFRGRRYKCLICYDYDLCSNCYENGSTTNQHTAEHPMQCILTRHDFDIFHGGEPLSADHPQSLTCPFCGKMGHTETTLQEHVISNHTDVSYEVVCPICASNIGGDPNHITDDFADHLAVDHQTASHLQSPVQRREINAGLGDLFGCGSLMKRSEVSVIDYRPIGTAISLMPYAHAVNPSEGNSRHSMRRMPHQGRGINRGVSGQSMRFGDSMDPIAGLLSQLSGVGRSAAGELTSSIHLHQEARMRRQMQLYRMGSSNSTSGFAPTGTTVSKSQNNTGTATISGDVSSGVTGPAPAQAAPTGGNVPNLVPSYSTQTNTVGGGQQTASNSKATPGAQSFLLSRLVELEGGDDSGVSSRPRSSFIQELTLSTLSDDSSQTQSPVVDLLSNLNLADSGASHEDNQATTTPTPTTDTSTQTEMVVVSPTSTHTSAGFAMSKALAHSVMKAGRGPVRGIRTSPRTMPMLPPTSEPSAPHARIVTGSGTVSVPPPPLGRGVRMGSSEPVSPGVNRRKPVRGEGRAHPPPN